MLTDKLIEKAAKAMAIADMESARSGSWRLAAMTAFAVFEQAQADHDAAVLEQAADEIKGGFNSVTLSSERRQIKRWLRARAAQIREGAKR